MYGTAGGNGAGQAIFTDDVSLQVFMEHLKRLVSRSCHIFEDMKLTNHRRWGHRRISFFPVRCMSFLLQNVFFVLFLNSLSVNALLWCGIVLVASQSSGGRHEGFRSDKEEIKIEG